MKIKTVLTYLGWTMVASSTIIFYYIFYTAYFSGVFQTLVTVNDYNEAHIEVIVFSLLLPLAVYFIIKSFPLKQNEEIK